MSGKKEFVDNTLVAGPDSVQYTVQGQRSDQSGPLSEIFTVNFGQNTGGGFAAVVAGGHGLETRATYDGLETRATYDGLETRATHDGFETRPTASTVNGREVRKVLPNGNGNAKRANGRR